MSCIGKFLEAVGLKPKPLIHGIPNLVNVTGNVWRGGQPTPEGWKYLQSIGVEDVLKLNTTDEGSDAVGEALGMDIYPIPITMEMQLGNDPVPLEKLVREIEYIPTNGLYIHCGSDARTSPDSFAAVTNTQGGQNRTGLAVMIYRVVRDNWPKQKAVDEMLKLGGWTDLPGLWAVVERFRWPPIK